jgi:hypothetical protein
MMFKRRRTFQSILDECLTEVERGEPLDAVLARFPEQSDELRPLLETAWQVGSVPPARPRVFAQQAGLQRFLGEATVMARGQMRPIVTVWRPLAAAASLLLVLFLAGGGTVYAASRSMPDSPLYPVKLAAEEARLWFVFDDEDRADILLDQAETRIDEINHLVAHGKSVDGRVLAAMRSRTSRAADIINKPDAPPDLVARTETLSSLQEEILISIQTWVKPGASDDYASALATVHDVRIQIVHVAQQPSPTDPELLTSGVGSFVGLVEELGDNSWVVGGTQVVVDERTLVEGDEAEAVGRVAKVTIVREPDGTVRAWEISLPATLDLASTLRISGVVDNVTEDAVEIAGRQVALGPYTLQGGRIDEGTLIEITGQATDRTFQADLIQSTTVEQQETAFAYEGAVEEMASTRWTVGGRTFLVSPRTPVDAGLISLQAGSRARVEAVTAGADLLADRIILLSDGRSDDIVALEGVFQGVADGVWIIGGTEVAVVAEDEPLEAPPVGALVRLTGSVERDAIAVSETQVIRQPDEAGLLKLEGVMTQLSQDAWLVGPVRIQISDATSLVGQPISGARAVVWAQPGLGDVLEALYVNVLDSQSLLAANLALP